MQIITKRNHECYHERTNDRFLKIFDVTLAEADDIQTN